jgi:hypothetical protein
MFLDKPRTFGQLRRSFPPVHYIAPERPRSIRLSMKPLYLVDGFNFLHAVLLQGRKRSHWWSPENRERVVEAVAALRAAPDLMAAAESVDIAPSPGFAGSPGLDAGSGPDVWVVFDQREPESDAAVGAGGRAPQLRGGLQIHLAPDADDYIVARCAELAGLRAVVVVSADRSLCDRAKNHGARGLSPWAFASYATAKG